jgi:hypothetical protein
MFANARKLHEENPKTFPRNISALAVGAFAKICHLGSKADFSERFWIKVTRIEGRIVEGLVFNETYRFKYMSKLSVDKDNIYAIYLGEPGTGGEEDNIRGVCNTCNEA